MMAVRQVKLLHFPRKGRRRISSAEAFPDLSCDGEARMHMQVLEHNVHEIAWNEEAER